MNNKVLWAIVVVLALVVVWQQSVISNNSGGNQSAQSENGQSTAPEPYFSSGTVISVDGASIVVDLGQGGQATLNTESETEIIQQVDVNGSVELQSISVEQVRVGSSVIILPPVPQGQPSFTPDKIQVVN